jgi:tetratricopeptide (TPR) repeat protein
MTRTVGVSVLTLTAAALLSVSPVPAQKSGGATGSGTTGAGTSTGAGTGTGATGTGNTGIGTPGLGRTPTTTTPNTTQPTQPANQQPIFLSGRVMLEDGTAPTEPVVLQTVCNGNPHSEGYTDGKGYFSIELGRNRGMIQDASEFDSSTPGLNNNNGIFGANTSQQMNRNMDPERRYMGCDLQAKLPGFRSQTVSLTGRRPMDDPNVGTILMHRLGSQDEGRTVSMASLAAPKDAKKAFEKGIDAIKKKKFADAQNSFEKSVEIYPNYAEAWYELGRLRAAQNQFDIARGSFEQAIKADPKYVPPYVGLSVIEVEGKRWQEVADLTDKTVKLDPFDYPQLYFYNSVANFNLRNIEAAEKSGLEAERLDTRKLFPQVQHLLGMICADRKDWECSAKRFKEYLRLAPAGADVDKVRAQLDQVEKIQQQLATAKDH